MADQKTLKVIVADDERVSRQRLVRLLRKEPGIEIVAECVGGKSASKAIEEFKPDIAFLDIRMPDLSGVDVAEAGGSRVGAVVFVTAYDDFATRAFELNATDYILKPVEAVRLRQTLDRVRVRLQTSPPDAAEIQKLLHEVLASRQSQSPPASIERIAVRIDGVLRIIKTSEIEWMETDGNYLALHIGSAKHRIRQSAAEFEQLLDRSKFVRVHRQYIVNVERIREVHPWFSGDAVIVMDTGAKVRLARSYREKFHAVLHGESAFKDGDSLEQQA